MALCDSSCRGLTNWLYASVENALLLKVLIKEKVNNNQFDQNKASISIGYRWIEKMATFSRIPILFSKRIGGRLPPKCDSVNGKKQLIPLNYKPGNRRGETSPWLLKFATTHQFTPVSCQLLEAAESSTAWQTFCVSMASWNVGAQGSPVSMLFRKSATWCMKLCS